ncbi:hypothetical protein HCA46_09265 [Listeria booriae]|uniref:Uncharacterized protein n=1 Tax=Listeria booriae TaxID=1552123 RepID=A0A7X0XQU4_9LIST|nr:hypothetical protein [Listeria booriae]
MALTLFSIYKYAVDVSKVLASKFNKSVIPSKHFNSKREELTTKLEGYINDASDKRSRLTAARDKAYERYVHYRDAAAKEG